MRVAVLVGRRRRDAVDHGGGAGDLARDEGAEIRVAQLREAVDDPLGDAAVRREIVAGEHREGRDARRAAAREAPRR